MFALILIIVTNWQLRVRCYSFYSIPELVHSLDIHTHTYIYILALISCNLTTIYCNLTAPQLVWSPHCQNLCSCPLPHLTIAFSLHWLFHSSIMYWLCFYLPKLFLIILECLLFTELPIPEICLHVFIVLYLPCSPSAQRPPFAYFELIWIYWVEGGGFIFSPRRCSTRGFELTKYFSFSVK